MKLVIFNLTAKKTKKKNRKKLVQYFHLFSFKTIRKKITRLRHRVALHDTDIIINPGRPCSLILIKSYIDSPSALNTY